MCFIFSFYQLCILFSKQDWFYCPRVFSRVRLSVVSTQLAHSLLRRKSVLCTRARHWYLATFCCFEMSESFSGLPEHYRATTMIIFLCKEQGSVRMIPNLWCDHETLLYCYIWILFTQVTTTIWNTGRCIADDIEILMLII